MKYLKYSLYIVLAAMVGIACEVQSDKFPVDIEKMNEPDETGGFLRITNIEQGAWDLLNLGEAAFKFTIEADDNQQGGQLESVDFYVGFTDQDDPEGDSPGNIPETADPILTVPASEFTEGENGLPQATLSIDANTVIQALGINPDNLEDFDTFDFRWVLHMTNGKSFSVDNTGLNITGGAFYNSPFQRRVLVGKLVPEDQFVGTYTVTRTSGSGIFGGIFSGSGEFTAEFRVDPNNAINGRVFDAPYLPQLGFTTPITWNVILVRVTGGPNEVIFPEQGTGLSCGGPGLFLGMQDGLTPGTFTVDADESWTMNITDNTRSGCGAGPSNASYTLTKN